MEDQMGFTGVQIMRARENIGRAAWLCLPLRLHRAFNLDRCRTMHEYLVASCKVIIARNHGGLCRVMLNNEELYGKYPPLTDAEIVDIVGILFQEANTREIPSENLFDDEIVNWVLLERGVDKQTLYEEQYELFDLEDIESISERAYNFENFDTSIISKVLPRLRHLLIMQMLHENGSDREACARIIKIFNREWI